MWPPLVGLVAALVIGGLLGAIGIAMLFVVQRGDTLSVDADLESVMAGLMKFILSPGPVVLAAACSAVAWIGVSLVGARLGRAAVAVRLRLGRGRLRWGHAVLAAVGAVVLSWSCGAVTSLLRVKESGSLAMLHEAFAAASPLTLTGAVLAVGVLAPIGEEVFFRGFTQTRFADRWGRWVAVAVTAALFGLVHMDRIQSLFAFLLGLYLGWITEVSGSIRLAVGAHILNNCVAVLLSGLGGRAEEEAEPWSLQLAMFAASLIVFCAVVLVVRSAGRRAASASAAPAANAAVAVG